MTNELHEVQASILKELLFNNGTNFAALNKLGLPNDHFTFHLKRLVSEEIIEKKGKLYFLTQKGKQFGAKLDIYGMKMEKFGTPSVAVTATRIINGKKHYLIQQRLKEPMYGYYGFINGKVKFSEFTEECAKRELLEETGLKGEVELAAIQHKMRGPYRDEIKLDHFFFIYISKKAKGELKDTNEGKNYWKTEAEIRKMNTFPGFGLTFDTITKKNQSKYLEKFIKVEEI